MDIIERSQKEFSLLDCVPIGNCIIRSDYTILFWNYCLEQWTKMPREQVLGTFLNQLFPHLKQFRFTERLEQIFQGGPPTIFSSQLHNFFIPASLPQGRWRIQQTTVTAIPALEEDGFYALISTQDVTDSTFRVQEYRQLRDRAVEAKETAQAAQLETEKYATKLILAMDAAQMGSWDWDLSTNKIEATIHFKRIFDFGEFDEITYDNWIERVHPDDVEQVKTLLQKSIKTQKNYDVQYRIIWTDGSLHWVSALGRGYDDARGLPTRMVGMVVDISDRKQAEIQLKEHATALRALNTNLTQTTHLLAKRNQELDRFVYVVSHDLKAPLRAISNLSEWIEDDLEGQLSEENQQQMKLLRNRVYRLDGLIDGLLAYSRVGRTEIVSQKVDVGELLDEIVDSLMVPDAFTIKVRSPMPTLFTKRLLLSQVFSNLISNAIKHHDRPDGRIEIWATKKRNYYEFAVADDGPGIASEYHEKIFVIFQTLKSRDTQENTGIGLSIVKKIIETENGEIILDSQLGKGAIFRFTWLIEPREKNVEEDEEIIR
jgi:PAS domain S-box-containing protein